LSLYLDTSLLVAALTNETATQKTQTWLASQPASELHVSGWVVTEFSSALSMKVRLGHLTSSHRAEALSLFQRLIADSLGLWPVTGSHFRTAARFADQHHLGLRAGDALHLAIAFEQGAKLCTLDRRLSEAANAVGASTQLLLE